MRPWLVGLLVGSLVAGCATTRPGLNGCSTGDRVLGAAAQIALVSLQVAALAEGRAVAPAPPQPTACK